MTSTEVPSRERTHNGITPSESFHGQEYDPYLEHSANSAAPKSASYHSLLEPNRAATGKLAVEFENSLHYDDSGIKQGLSFKLLLPTFIVCLTTAGLGITLIVWLLTHKTQSSLSEVWKDGAFLLDEGTKIEGDLEASRLIGLTIASAASTAVGIITPILMGLYAFRTAHIWLSSPNTNLPTPLQYGLLLEILGSSSLGSLWNAGSYLLRGSAKRSRAVSMFREAFVVGIAAYVLTHAVSGVDLWLHTVTSAIIQVAEKPSDSAFLNSVAQNTCLPYPEPWYKAVYPCMYGAGTWGDGVNSLTPGMLVTSNSSQSLQAITLANASDLAVLVDPSVSQNTAFRMTTFGARASCQSVNPLCSTAEGTYNGTCAGFPPSFPPVNASSQGGLLPGGSQAFMQSSNCEGCAHISSDQILTSGSTAVLNPTATPPVNLYSLWMQFLWLSSGDTPFIGSEGNKAISGYSNEATMLTNCTLSFYNVTLDYRNGTYASFDEVLSNTGLSDGFAGPTRLGHYSTRLISDIEGIAFTANSSDDVIAFLNQDLARLAIGSAATITNLKSSTLSHNLLVNQILGRYPFWPVCLLIALLFANSGFALTIFISAVVSGTRKIVVPGRSDTVSTLQLAQLRLTSPTALVSEFIASPAIEEESIRVALSAKTSALDMFQELHSGEIKLRAGLHQHGQNGAIIFGLSRIAQGTGEDGWREK